MLQLAWEREGREAEVTSFPNESPIAVQGNKKLRCTKHNQQLFYVYEVDGKPRFVCQVCEDEYYTKKIRERIEK